MVLHVLAPAHQDVRVAGAGVMERVMHHVIDDIANHETREDG